MLVVGEALKQIEEGRVDTFLTWYIAEGAANLHNTLREAPVVFKVNIECAEELSNEVENWLQNEQAKNMVGLNPDIKGLWKDIFFQSRVYRKDKTHFEVNYYSQNEAGLDTYLNSDALKGAIGEAMPEWKTKLKVTRQKGVINNENQERGSSFYERTTV